MSYHWAEKGKKIRIEGQLVNPIILDVKDVVSYLNGQSDNFDMHRDMLKNLLKASLDGRDQNIIQNEVAVMLGYPGIQGFIEENYGNVNRSKSI